LHLFTCITKYKLYKLLQIVVASVFTVLSYYFGIKHGFADE